MNVASLHDGGTFALHRGRSRGCRPHHGVTPIDLRAYYTQHELALQRRTEAEAVHKAPAVAREPNAYGTLQLVPYNLRACCWAWASRCRQTAPQGTNARGHLEAQGDQKHCATSVARQTL